MFARPSPWYDNSGLISILVIFCGVCDIQEPHSFKSILQAIAGQSMRSLLEFFTGANSEFLSHSRTPNRLGAIKG